MYVLIVCAACGGGTASTPDGSPDANASADAPSGTDAAPQDDGTPTRVPCTNNLGSALTTVHGRLDGYLVSIVPSTSHNCNGDNSHVHLQVKANGAVYDVAVNVSDPQDVDYLAKDLALPDGAWSEGWHPGQGSFLDYVTLGVHSTDFAPTPQTQLENAIGTELASANHVSIFMTGYGTDGGHLVHRNGGGSDGAIVIRPLGAPRLLMFHFSTQSF
jgi:hypothetical protein